MPWKPWEGLEAWARVRVRVRYVKVRTEAEVILGPAVGEGCMWTLTLAPAVMGARIDRMELEPGLHLESRAAGVLGGYGDMGTWGTGEHAIDRYHSTVIARLGRSGWPNEVDRI